MMHVVHFLTSKWQGIRNAGYPGTLLCFSCSRDAWAPQDIAIMKQMHKHEARPRVLLIESWLSPELAKRQYDCLRLHDHFCVLRPTKIVDVFCFFQVELSNQEAKILFWWSVFFDMFGVFLNSKCANHFGNTCRIPVEHILLAFHIYAANRVLDWIRTYLINLYRNMFKHNGCVFGDVFVFLKVRIAFEINHCSECHCCCTVDFVWWLTWNVCEPEPASRISN